MEKLTDEQIVKALEGMTYGGHSCMHCKYGTTKGDDRCGLQGCKIGRDALDLINRQKAESEQWKDKYMNLWCEPDSDIHKVKVEVIKMFARKLKAISHPYGDTQIVFELQIDNLVKEMTEGRCEV